MGTWDQTTVECRALVRSGRPGFRGITFQSPDVALYMINACSRWRHLGRQVSEILLVESDSGAGGQSMGNVPVLHI